MKSENLKVNREDVYRAIDSERMYQEVLPRNVVTDQRPIEQLALIRHIIHEIDTQWYYNSGPITMDPFRKIAAVAVRCMEQYGAPARELPPALPAPTPAAVTAVAPAPSQVACPIGSRENPFVDGQWAGLGLSIEGAVINLFKESGKERTLLEIQDCLYARGARNGPGYNVYEHMEAVIHSLRKAGVLGRGTTNRQYVLMGM